MYFAHLCTRFLEYCALTLLQKSSFSCRVQIGLEMIGSPFRVCVCGGMLYTPKKQKRVCICLHAGLCHFLDSSSSIAESSQEPFRMNCGDQLCVTWLMIQRGNCLGKQKVVFVWLCVCHPSHLLFFFLLLLWLLLSLLLFTLPFDLPIQGSFGPHFPGHVLI